MAKSGKRVLVDGAYGLSGLLMKPVYNMIREERMEERRRYNQRMKEISQDLLIEASLPRRFEVYQPYDTLIHEHPIW